jgi:1,4-dihydroxy-2-naphthoate octaprenyltransferase
LIEKVWILADISSRGGKVPPIYLYLVFILPGFAYSIATTGNINYLPFILISISIVPLVIATNLYDDYFDFVKGYDRIDSPNTIYRRHPIFYYKVSQRYLIGWAVTFSIIYLLLSFVISLRYGLVLNIISIVGLLLGYGYTGPPFGYKYRGLGEIGVFFSTIAASEFISVASIGRFYPSSILYFVPFALLISLLLFIGNYRDLDSDKRSGFRTLAVILGKGKSSSVPMVTFSLFYVAIVVLYLLGIYGKFSLIALVTSPIAYYFSLRWTRRESIRFEIYAGPFLFGILMSLIVILLI